MIANTDKITMIMHNGMHTHKLTFPVDQCINLNWEGGGGGGGANN